MSFSSHEVWYWHTTACQLSYGKGKKKYILASFLCQLVWKTAHAKQLPRKINFKGTQKIVLFVQIWKLNHELCWKALHLRKCGISTLFQLTSSLWKSQCMLFLRCHSHTSLCTHMLTVTASKAKANTHANDERIHNQNWWTEEKANEHMHWYSAPAPSSLFFSTRSLEK